MSKSVRPLLITHHSLLITCLFSVRERLAGSGDAYAVVCELEVRAGQLDLRHVARGATLLCDGAGPGVAFVRRLGLRHLRRPKARLRAVAGEALRVVEGLFASRVVVRVVAGRAAHTRVEGFVAAAREEAVGLEGHALAALVLSIGEGLLVPLVARDAQRLRQLSTR